jgi:hypothetical protein
VLLLFVSCGNKEDILLPKSNVTIIKDIQDHSPIYIFFRTKDKDTLAEVNRKSSIISTNWIFNIDKRLPLRLVIPEVMKLQEKKRNEKAHKNEAAQNYYSYADSIGKNLAFIPFTEVYYKLEKPKLQVIVFFNKDNGIWVDKVKIKREFLNPFLVQFVGKTDTNSYRVSFCFDKNMSFGNYIQNKIFVGSLSFPKSKQSVSSQEFVY